MIFINPWWVHHCIGNLDPENDPYSEKYENPTNSIKHPYLLIILTFIWLILYGLCFYYTVRFFMSFDNYYMLLLFIVAFIIELIPFIWIYEKIAKFTI